MVEHIRADESAPRAHRDKFFLITSLLMLAGVVFGFSPTFFARPVFVGKPLPILYVVHGVSLTAWYILLPLQAYLAGTRRMRWHRWLGWAGVVAAAGVLVSMTQVTAEYVPRGLREGQPEFIVALIALIDVFRLPYFGILVGLAILRRGTPEIHKRALLVASASNFAPAAARIALIFGGSAILGVLFPLAFIGALAVHDRRRLGRMHAVTKWGLWVQVVIQILPMIPAFQDLASPVMDVLKQT